MEDKVIEVCDLDDMHRALESKRFGSIIGIAIKKWYPKLEFVVTINMYGGVAHIRLPKISGRRGVTIKLTRDTLSLERAAQMMVSEALERFRVSRGHTQDFTHLNRNVMGEADAAIHGEWNPTPARPQQRVYR